MSADAQRFAQRVLDAFRDAGRATDAEVARANGPSTSTMTMLRKVAAGEADMAQPREPTWSNIDRAANWAPGSARSVWGGAEPVVRKDATVHAVTATASVGASLEAGDTLLFKRPEGLTDEEWTDLKARNREHWEWLLDRASKER